MHNGKNEAQNCLIQTFFQKKLFTWTYLPSIKIYSNRNYQGNFIEGILLPQFLTQKVQSQDIAILKKLKTLRSSEFVKFYCFVVVILFCLSKITQVTQFLSQLSTKVENWVELSSHWVTRGLFDRFKRTGMRMYQIKCTQTLRNEYKVCKRLPSIKLPW